MNTEKIFILDSEEGFRLSEAFKAKLENEGYNVTTTPYAFSGVRITGRKK